MCIEGIKFQLPPVLFYLDLPGYPKGLCLRDTPGLNDTFMMREQITLNAISESRVCLFVLSAHQVLATMALALLCNCFAGLAAQRKDDPRPPPQAPEARSPRRARTSCGATQIATAWNAKLLTTSTRS